MKKFALFLAPLMAITFLTNCGGTKQYTVTFDPNGGKWTDGSTNSKTITVKEKEKATKPRENPTREGPDDDHGYVFNEWQLDGNKFDFTTTITSDITLKADWNIVSKYIVSIGTHEHLSFLTTDGKDLSTIKATEGQDFKFKMKAENVSNDIEYVIPTALDIKIDDKQPLAPTFYSIMPHEGNKEADVTIKGIKVIGNITVSGSAAITGKYNYKISNHDGLNIDVPSEGSKGALENLVITFTPQAKESGSGTYAKPNAENILIQFDNAPGDNPIQWVSPSEKDVGEFCTFNEGSGELTIKPKYIRNNIDIKTRSPDYPVLEKMTWKEIESYSFSGYAPYIFYIGEEKFVKVNGLNHKVRIIDFNHDYINPKKSDETKVGITFEFAELISENDGNSIKSMWDQQGAAEAKYYNFNFPGSILNKFLNNNNDCIFKKLPIDLQSTVKLVNKKVGVSTDGGDSYHLTDYTTKLFPLSLEEISDYKDYYVKDEGTRYQYYINALDIVRKKSDKNNKYEGYWLRSPYTYIKKQHDELSAGGAGGINNDGSISSKDVGSPYAVAPAFCI